MSSVGEIFPFAVTERPAVEIVGELVLSGQQVVRDVIIDSGADGDLAAERGDFWFHTDGAFLRKPPRTVVIEVLEADSGGALSVLDLDPLAAVLADSRATCDDGAGEFAVALAEQFDGARCFRYRRDRMRPIDDSLQRAHDAIERASSEAFELGALRAGNSLILDNWRVAHRRQSFDGRRKIRRFWLS